MHRPAPSPSIWMAVAVAVVGCTSEGGFSRLDPQLVLLPDRIDFGQVVANQEVIAEGFNVENAGLTDLEIQSVIVGGADAARFTVDLDTSVIGPGDSATAMVTFAPDALRAFEAAITVASNDPEGPADVTLAGEGREPRLPDIDIAITCVTFADVAVNASSTRFFQVENVGEADLILGSMSQTGSGAFVVSDQSGSVIAPGDSELLTVEYTPRIPDQGDSGTLTIPSNDPDEPTVEVCLEGNGGGDYGYPEAVIDCPGQIPFLGATTIELDGSASSDPNKQPLSYAWSVVRRPQAADRSLAPDPDDEAVTSMLLDTAGVWEFSLVVTASSPFGPLPSVPAKCLVEALPTDAVYVELSWNGATADFDLHLAAGSAPFFSVPGDASWCNPTPDWGVQLDPTDDPVLGPDVSSGGGPEYVTLSRPADGYYVVRVHHFDDGVDGRTTANVQVFLAGQLAWAGAKVLERNEVWDVGQVNWPGQTFGAYTSPAYDAGGTRECE